MDWKQWELALFALMIWREARSQGELGMRAVGHVARNRNIRSGKPLGVVIVQDAQFTSINPYKKTYDSQLDVWPAPVDEAFETAMRIAEEITNGISKDPTGGATYYRNPATATSASFQADIDSGRIVHTITIGQHEFYALRVAARVPGVQGATA